MEALVVLEGVVIALLGVLVVGLLRSHAEILRTLHDLGAGVDPNRAVASNASSGSIAEPTLRTRPGVPEPRAEQTGAHDVVGTLPAGGAAAVGVVGTEHTTLLAFLTTGCSTCAGFWNAFAAGDAGTLPGRDTRLVVVTAGPERESPAAVAALAPQTHTTVMSSDAWDAYAVPVAPYFILVDGPGARVIGEGAAATWPQVVELMAKAVADAGVAPDGSAIVTPRPEGRLNGRERAQRAAHELSSAGIEPGHPSLYPPTTPIEPRER